MLTIMVAIADEISFVASAPNAVVVGQQFKLSYKVNRGNAKEPRIPAIAHILHPFPFDMDIVCFFRLKVHEISFPGNSKRGDENER